MFEMGTKVVVISSSCVKKIGPRRGSTGYFSVAQKTRVSTPLGVCVGKAEVVFNRYGFEKRSRREKRDVVTVFPIVGKGKGDIQQQVADVRASIVGEDDSDFKNHTRNYLGITRAVPMVLMYPTPCSTVNLLSCDHQEYRAWVDSLINNPYFSAFVSKSLQTKHFKNAQIEVLKSTSAWEQLLLIIMDHHAKEECVGNWLSNSVLRERKAKMLRLVSIMAMRSFTLKAERNINNYLMGKDLSSEIKRCNIYEALGDYIFNRPVLNLFEKFSVATGSRSLLSHSQNIEAIMGELGVLSSRASG